MKAAVAQLMAAVLAAGAAASASASAQAARPQTTGGLTAEVFANSVMRGTPICTTIVQNGFSAAPRALCPRAAGSARLVPGQYSIRLTGTLTAAAPATRWYRVAATVGPTAMVRLWVDDHRLVDAWDPAAARRSPPSPPPPPPPGYTVVPAANMPSNAGEFGGRGKVTGVKDNMAPCATACDSLRAEGCVGWVYASAAGTCYMRRPAPGKSCPGSIVHAPSYAVYARNASCVFPAGWEPAGYKPPPPHTDPDVPETPGLSSNVTLTSARPVFVRVDLRPMDAAEPVTLTLKWSSVPGATPVPVPAAALSPAVSDEQQKRRALQEQAATGWNHWQRSSQLAVQALPQQFGVQLSVQQPAGGAAYSGALPQPRSRQVKMGPHAYDGSYSHISFVPFPDPADPCLKGGQEPCRGANVTVETAHVPPAVAAKSTSTAAAAPSDCVLVASCSGACAGLSLRVDAAAFWGASVNVSRGNRGGGDAARTLTMTSGDLGSVVVSVAGGSVSAGAQCGSRPCLSVPLDGGGAIAVTLSFQGAPLSVAAAAAAVGRQRGRTLAALAAGAARAKGLAEAYAAMSTVIAWNVNFDPRVAVTAPVSRTFEAGFDFIFFDWDMYFLSLMAGTSPAAEDPGAWGVAVSNLIEVTQTRSVYGHVMNKRAASGSTTSDTNDRTEPLVGSAVVLRMLEDAKGTARESTMLWVARLLFPTLLGWNQWAWNLRRYNVGADAPHGGLLVLGNDVGHLPCEGGTVYEPSACGSRGGAILESGMDNSPMYYNAFNNTVADYDADAGRIQLYDVQMSALFVSESLALQQLASVADQAALDPLIPPRPRVLALTYKTAMPLYIPGHAFRYRDGFRAGDV